MIKMDKDHSGSTTIAFKEVQIKGTSLHRVKYVVEDMDDALLIAKRYIRPEDIQKNRPIASAEMIFVIPSNPNKLRKLKKWFGHRKRSLKCRSILFNLNT